MALSLATSTFVIDRDPNRCISCQVCVRQCANDVHYYVESEDAVKSREQNCVGCHRCVTLCPTHALTIRENPLDFRPHANWSADVLKNIYKQAQTGGMLLSGMGCDQPYPIYWDHMLINASQVTNPSIDPLREPMELRTYLGRKTDQIALNADGNIDLSVQPSPQLQLEVPIMFSAMSYGSISFNACLSLARAASEIGTY